MELDIRNTPKSGSNAVQSAEGRGPAILENHLETKNNTKD